MDLHPLPVGTRVAHYGQKWAWSGGIATATIREVLRQEHDGAWEYLVTACEDISRRPGPDNPETRETQWASYHTMIVEEIDV